MVCAAAQRSTPRSPRARRATWKLRELGSGSTPDTFCLVPGIVLTILLFLRRYDESAVKCVVSHQLPRPRPTSVQRSCLLVTPLRVVSLRITSVKAPVIYKQHTFSRCAIQVLHLQHAVPVDVCFESSGHPPCKFVLKPAEQTLPVYGLTTLQLACDGG